MRLDKINEITTRLLNIDASIQDLMGAAANETDFDIKIEVTPREERKEEHADVSWVEEMRMQYQQAGLTGTRWVQPTSNEENTTPTYRGMSAATKIKIIGVLVEDKMAERKELIKQLKNETTPRRK